MADKNLTNLTELAAGGAATNIFYTVQGGNSRKGTGISALFNFGTLTASTPLNITQTWNDGGVEFVAFNFAITDTASHGQSRVFQVTNGGSHVFSVRKDGAFAGDAVNERLTFFSHPVGMQLRLATNGFYPISSGSNCDLGAFAGGQAWRHLTIKGDFQFEASDTPDLVVKRAAAKVLSFEAVSSAGGTFRTIATSPAQITSNQDNYNPGGSSRFQRWNSDAARDVTGMTFTAAQVDGQEHIVYNVGAQNITLKEQVTSTAANQFLNSTGADIVLAPKQSAHMIYDGTTSRWRVSKMN